MVFFLQHPLKDQLVAVDAALALGRAEGAVAPGLEELLHGQGLGRTRPGPGPRPGPDARRTPRCPGRWPCSGMRA